MNGVATRRHSRASRGDSSPHVAYTFVYRKVKKMGIYHNIVGKFRRRVQGKLFCLVGGKESVSYEIKPYCDAPPFLSLFAQTRSHATINCTLCRVDLSQLNSNMAYSKRAAGKISNFDIRRLIARSRHFQPFLISLHHQIFTTSISIIIAFSNFCQITLCWVSLFDFL